MWRKCWAAACAVLLAACVLALPPMAGTAYAADIISAGPLRLVQISPDLNCNVQHAQDTSSSWYNGTDCGTFISLNGRVFGPPTSPGAGFSRTAYTRVSQSPVTGSGTEADPYVLVTVVDAGAGARLVQTDSYVVGREAYQTSVTVTNLSAVTQIGNIYTAGDCFLQGSDRGYGRVSGSAPACVASTAPGSRAIQLLPRTGGNSYLESAYNTVWNRIGQQLPFQNTCACATLLDNAIGISWPVSLASGASRTWEWSTLFSPTGEIPIVVTATAHAPTATPGSGNGYRVNVINDNDFAASADTVTVTLPAGFSYVPGSTVGATTNDPAVSGQTLIWTGPFPLSAGGTIALDFDVVVSTMPGTYTIDATAAVPNLTVNAAEDAAAIAVQPVTDLSLTKTVSTPTAIAGATTLIYTLTVTNNGPSPADGVYVTDTLPGVMVFSAADSSPGCFAVGQQVRCDVGSLANGASATVRIGARIPPNATAGVRTNAALVAGNAQDPVPANNSGSTTVTVSRSADLSVTKTANSATSIAGSSTSFTIVVRNAGPSQTVATLTDIVPAGFSPTSMTSPCTLTAGPRCVLTLSPGAAVTLTLTGTLAPAIDPGTVLTDTANVTSVDPDPNTGNNSSAANTTVQRSTDMGITKVVNADGLRAGSTGIYVLTVTNGGPSVASAVTVTDVLDPGLTFVPGASSPGCTAPNTPGATVTCDVGTLQPGRIITLSIGVAVPASAPAGAGITNTASVAAAEPDPAPANNSSTITTPITRSVDLTLSKTAVSQPLVAGGPVTYRLTVVNDGPSDASNVVVTDTLPSALVPGTATVTAGTGTCAMGPPVSCTLPTLAAGATATIEITATVSPTQPPGAISNTAVVSSAEPDLEPADNTGVEVTDVVATTGLRVSKIESPVPAVAGDTLEYIVQITNQGPSTSTGITLTDPLPGGFTGTAVSPVSCTLAANTVNCPALGTLNPGESVTVTITGTVAASLASGHVLDNTVTVTDDQGGRAEGHEQTTVVRRTNVTITKTALTDPIAAGAPMSWRVTIRNNGPSDTSGVVVVEVPNPGFITSGITGADCDLATLRCSLDPLQVGAEISITVTGSVRPDQPVGPMVNRATVTSPDSDPADNSTISAVEVERLADLTVTKSSQPETVAAGTLVSYAITITNAGPSSATETTATDTLPAGLTFDPANSSDGCTASGSVVTCAVGRLSPGGSQGLTIAAITDPGLDATVTDNVSVVSAEDDATPATASAQTNVNPLADLSVAKSGSPAYAGANLTWTITVANLGVSDATDVLVTDVITVGFGFVSASVPGGTCTFAAATRTVTCDLPLVPDGATVEITLVETTPPDLVPPDVAQVAVTNNAAVSAAAPDPDLANNEATGQSIISAAVTVAATKTASPEPVTAGGLVTYLVTVHNEGPSVATGVTITDLLPLRSFLVDPGPCTVAPGNSLTCPIPDPMAPGTDRQFTFTAQIDPSLAQGSIVVNTVTARAQQFDPDPAPDGQATSTVQRQVDLAVTGQVSATQIAAGESFSYTLTVTNSGPSAAGNVVLTDTLTETPPALRQLPPCPGPFPGGGCEIADLAPGASVAVTYTVGTLPETPDGTVITITATVTSAEDDTVPANNSIELAVTVVRVANLTVTKAPDRTTVAPGGIVVWTIGITNSGPSVIDIPALDDALHEGLAFRLEGSSPSCGSATTPTVRCTIGRIAVGQTVTLRVATLVAAAAVGRLTNRASFVTATRTVIIDADVLVVTPGEPIPPELADGGLPATGDRTAPLVWLAVALVLAGAMLTRVATRRRPGKAWKARMKLLRRA